MDDLKKETMRDYSNCDLNIKIVHIKNRQSLEHFFKRKARRKNRQKMKEILDNYK